MAEPTISTTRSIGTVELARMNEALILVRFYRQGNVIIGDYSLSYEGGLSPRLFIRVLQRFADIFVTGLRLQKRRQGLLPP